MIVNSLILPRNEISLLNKILKVMVLLIFFSLCKQCWAGIELETMTVIVDSDDGRKIFNVKNSSSDEPVLLSTKVTDLAGGGDFSKNIMVYPPIIRIDPGQGQQINFVVRKGVKIPNELILKVSFQGVGLKKDNISKMPIRQDVALIVTPPGLSISQTPWRDLKVTLSNGLLTLFNKGSQVVRLSPDIEVVPGDSKMKINLEQFYIRPGERKEFGVGNGVVMSGIKIFPLSRYGFKIPGDVILPIENK